MCLLHWVGCPPGRSQLSTEELGFFWIDWFMQKPSALYQSCFISGGLKGTGVFTSLINRWDGEISLSLMKELCMTPTFWLSPWNKQVNSVFCYWASFLCLSTMAAGRVQKSGVFFSPSLSSFLNFLQSTWSLTGQQDWGSTKRSLILAHVSDINCGYFLLYFFPQHK